MNPIWSDYLQCETLIEQTLTPRQREIVDDPPIWDLNPPQREGYEDIKAYVIALGEYADRVIASKSTF